jgi:hypothetical protein
MTQGGVRAHVRVCRRAREIAGRRCPESVQAAGTAEKVPPSLVLVVVCSGNRIHRHAADGIADRVPAPGTVMLVCALVTCVFFAVHLRYPSLVVTTRQHLVSRDWPCSVCDMKRWVRLTEIVSSPYASIAPSSSRNRLPSVPSRLFRLDQCGLARRSPGDDRHTFDLHRRDQSTMSRQCTPQGLDEPFV